MIFQDAGLGGVEGTKPPKEAYVPPHLRGKSGGAPPPDSGKYFIIVNGSRKTFQIKAKIVLIIKNYGDFFFHQIFKLARNSLLKLKNQSWFFCLSTRCSRKKSCRGKKK